MRVRIHRGAAQVGGTAIEIESEGDRLVLEAGLPLSLDGVAYRDLQPDVPGLWSDGDGSLKGLIISHGHPDHYGLADLVAPGVPIYMGGAAKAIIDEAAFFNGRDPGFELTGHLEDRRPLRLGSLTVTPWLVDHSGFDAYALLVEAGGKRLFYSGDLRGHGRKAGTFDRLVSRPPRDVDCLLLEGTTIGRGEVSPPGYADEQTLERHLADRFSETSGMALAFYSAQNIDRLVTVYRAAIASGRRLVLDLYGATVAAATGLESIPQAGWERVRVFVPRNQKFQVVSSKEFRRVDDLKANRVFLEELAREPADWVLTARAGFLDELGRSGCLERAEAFWMMWSGYLGGAGGEETRGCLDSLGIPMELAHVSGHAGVGDLKKLEAAIRPKQLVPVHSDAADRYPQHFGHVSLRNDGEWWSV